MPSDSDSEYTPVMSSEPDHDLKYVLVYDLSKFGSSRYAPRLLRPARPEESDIAGDITCKWRLPDSAEEFQHLYGKDDLDAFIEKYHKDKPRSMADWNHQKLDLNDFHYSEVVIELKRVFHQPTVVQERLLVAPWLPSQVVSCHMRAILGQVDAPFCPFSHYSPWILAAQFKTNSYGIISDVFHPKWASDPDWTDDYMYLVVPREQLYNILQQGVNTHFNRHIPYLKSQMENWLLQIQRIFPKDVGWRKDTFYREENPYWDINREREFPHPVIPTLSHDSGPPSNTPRADLWRRKLDPLTLLHYGNQMTRRRSFSDAQRGKTWPHRDWTDLRFDNPPRVVEIFTSRWRAARSFTQAADELRGLLMYEAPYDHGPDC